MTVPETLPWLSPPTSQSPVSRSDTASNVVSTVPSALFAFTLVVILPSHLSATLIRPATKHSNLHPGDLPATKDEIASLSSPPLSSSLVAHPRLMAIALAGSSQMPALPGTNLQLVVAMLLIESLPIAPMVPVALPVHVTAIPAALSSSSSPFVPGTVLDVISLVSATAFVSHSPAPASVQREFFHFPTATFSQCTHIGPAIADDAVSVIKPAVTTSPMASFKRFMSYIPSLRVGLPILRRPSSTQKHRGIGFMSAPALPRIAATSRPSSNDNYTCSLSDHLGMPANARRLPLGLAPLHRTNDAPATLPGANRPTL